MEIDLSSIEHDSDLDLYEFGFDCIKCGYSYDSFRESEYGQCSNCSIMSCKNCRSLCEECSRNCCFKCSTYLECCNMNKCTHCYGFCGSHGEYECNKCVETYECYNCGYLTCKEYISTEHKNNIYCTDCSYDFCVLCDESIFIFENEDDEYFPNPCKECLQDIEKELLETNIELPVEIIKNIISYIVTE